MPQYGHVARQLEHFTREATPAEIAAQRAQDAARIAESAAGTSHPGLSANARGLIADTMAKIRGFGGKSRTSDQTFLERQQAARDQLAKSMPDLAAAGGLVDPDPNGVPIVPGWELLPRRTERPMTNCQLITFVVCLVTIFVGTFYLFPDARQALAFWCVVGAFCVAIDLLRTSELR